MNEQPTLTTARLVLRPYVPSDAKELQRLIGDHAVADTNVWVFILTLMIWRKSLSIKDNWSLKKINL